jgi:hypothetical protein
MSTFQCSPEKTIDYESIVDEYISDKEKKAEKPLSLETIMRFERPKSDGEFEKERFAEDGGSLTLVYQKEATLP